LLPKLEGDFEIMSVSDLVVWFANRQASGVLTMKNARVVKEFVLDHGSIVRATSTDPREYFGQFLIHYGLLTEDQLNRAFVTQRETNVLLGRILVMIGIVPEAQIVQTLRLKISESLLDTFRWTKGHFTFEPQAPDESRAEIQVNVPLPELHKEGIRRSEMWAAFDETFTKETPYLEVFDERVPTSCGPDTLEGRILQLARHGLSVDSITLELHATDYQVISRLFALHRIGAVAPSDVPVTSADIQIVDSNDLESSEIAGMPSATHEMDTTSPDVAKTRTLIPQTPQKFSKNDVPSLRVPLRSLEQGQITAKERYLLARIDGQRNVGAIIQVSPMTEHLANQLIEKFVSAGWVDFNAPAQTAPLL
jgi:hypothetical protein